MTLDRIWAGWRMPYMERAAAEHAPGGDVTSVGGEDRCVLCEVLRRGEPDEVTYVVWRGELCCAVLNLYPYTSGHLLVLPYRHAAGLEEISAEESSELWRATVDAVRALRVAYSPEGVNLGANLGRAAGAGVPGHFHLHVLGRWAGDANFVTTVAEARVLPEPLSDTWRRLKEAWPADAGGRSAPA